MIQSKKAEMLTTLLILTASQGSPNQSLTSYFVNNFVLSDNEFRGIVSRVTHGSGTPGVRGRDERVADNVEVACQLQAYHSVMMVCHQAKSLGGAQVILAHFDLIYLRFSQ